MHNQTIWVSAVKKVWPIFQQISWIQCIIWLDLEINQQSFAINIKEYKLIGKYGMLTSSTHHQQKCIFFWDTWDLTTNFYIKTSLYGLVLTMGGRLISSFKVLIASRNREFKPKYHLWVCQTDLDCLSCRYEILCKIWSPGRMHFCDSSTLVSQFITNDSSIENICITLTKVIQQIHSYPDRAWITS